MLEGIAKSFFAYLQRDPEIRGHVAKASSFISTLDARLARIEKALGIVDAEVIPLPTQKGAVNGEADKRG